MAEQKYVKRIIWVAECKQEGCEFRDIKSHERRGSIQCPNCRVWVPYIEQSSLAPELGQ
jgi:hypothetical protein